MNPFLSSLGSSKGCSVSVVLGHAHRLCTESVGADCVSSLGFETLPACSCLASEGCVVRGETRL